MITTTTHLNFRGTARSALEFYRSVWGGQLLITTYGDAGMPAEAPGASQVMFGLVVGENGFRVMAYDIPGQAASTIIGGTSTRRENGTTLTDQALFISVEAGTLAEAQEYWTRLAVGGAVVEPLAASAWSPGFGMLTDRFGVTWTVSVAAP